MGYFACGWPKTYILPEHRDTSSGNDHRTEQLPHPVHAIHLDPSDQYALTVSSRALHIWSAGLHRVLLARFVISDLVFDEEGPFIDAVWSFSSKAVIAAFEKGLVLLFSVIPYNGTSVLHFNFPDEHFVQPPDLYPLRFTRVTELRVAHGETSVTALTASPAGALLATSSAALTCISWDAEILWRAHIPELLRNNNAMAKMGVIPNGDLPLNPVLARIQQETPPDSAGGIIALTYNCELAYCGVVLADGPALLLAMHSAGHSRPSAIDGRWLRSSDAVSIALEPRRMLASVGLENGDVEQYYIGVPAGDQCPLMRTISLSSWYFEPSDIGRPIALRWTNDGSALVVGWERSGLAVWSVSGCRIMWTLPQVGGPLPTTPALRNKEARTFSSVSPMEQGVRAVAWGAHGFFLWASPRLTSESPPSMELCHFMEFTFLKSGLGGTSCHNESSRLAMLGSDRVLLLRHADAAVDEGSQQSGIASNDLFSWQHLIVPHDYVWRNWPLTNLAVSSDASHIAVAGQHGVAICHIRTQRWRVFGDLDQGRRMRCSALAWVGKTIVIGNEVVSQSARIGVTTTHELLFYLRDQGDSSNLQNQHSLPSRPVLTDVRSDGYLLVICEDARVFLFKMTEHYSRGRVDVHEVYNLLLPTRESGLMYRQDMQAKSVDGASVQYGSTSLPAPGGGITDAKIFPPLTHAHTSSESKASIPTQIMMLRSTGSLILLDTEQMVSTALLRYVERFWYTPVDCTPFDMMAHRPVWWAYGDDGLHVCFQDVPSVDGNNNGGSDIPVEEMISPRSVTPGRRKKVEVEQWLELDPEVYPLAIMSNYGMLIGATQGLVTNSVEMGGQPMPRHVIQVKRQPILHTLLRHLLIRPNCDERLALQVALKCVPQPQFVDSLEWLLYEAVLEHTDENDVGLNGSGNVHEDSNTRRLAKRPTQHNAIAVAQRFPESPRRKKAGSGLFPRVIRLLKYFGEYEDVVVRCARKLDSKRWPLLFSLAGEPAALLEQCFVSGRLRTAACLLIILQEMWGFISSTPHSLRLVEAALSRGEVDLAADLANFLSKADGAGMLNSSQLRSTEDVSWIAEAVRTPKGGALTKSLSRRESRDVPPDRIPAVDVAVLNYARWLLNRMELRNLVALSVKMDFPLEEWLRREQKGKSNSRPFVRDFGSTILSLHRQFQYAEPDLTDVRRAMKIFNQEMDIRKSRELPLEDIQQLGALVNGLSIKNDDHDGGSSTPKRPSADDDGIWTNTPMPSSALSTTSSLDGELSADRRIERMSVNQGELTYLMTTCRMARAPDLTLCCATLLLDISVLRTVLRGHEELFGPYLAALNELNASGYDALVAVMNEVAIPK